MFNSENVSVRFNRIEHQTMKKDDAGISLVAIQFELNPLTHQLANELDGFVRGMLFTRTDAEVAAKLRRASFELPIRPQSIAVRMAPDQGDASFVIDEAKITNIAARRGKKSAAWTLVFTATCAPESEHQLAQIVDCYTKSRFITMANAVPGLFDEEEKAERKKRAAPVRGQTVSAEATAH